MASDLSTDICVRPIGVVDVGLDRDSQARGSRYTTLSVIRVYDQYVPGLVGLEEYSHVFVVYWMHEVREVRLTVRPWGREDLPHVGIFATRFPPRPNPIGLSVVELVGVDPPRVLVRGLDAWSGTPVLDLKPYDYYDVVRKPRVPGWLRERWEQSRIAINKAAPWLGPCECGD